METWARQDPAAAASQAVRLTPGPAREEVLAQLGAEWTRQDKDAAGRWTQQLGEQDRALVLSALAPVSPLPRPGPNELVH